MATQKPIELYFVAPVYARGEHIIGENAHLKDGKVNMVRITRGSTKIIHFDAARDLIIAKQAIDQRNAKPEEMADAKEFVRAIEESEKKSRETESAKLKKAA